MTRKIRKQVKRVIRNKEQEEQKLEHEANKKKPNKEHHSKKQENSKRGKWVSTGMKPSNWVA